VAAFDRVDGRDVDDVFTVALERVREGELVVTVLDGDAGVRARAGEDTRRERDGDEGIRDAIDGEAVDTGRAGEAAAVRARVGDAADRVRG
jgi:hypothetical protein